MSQNHPEVNALYTKTLETETKRLGEFEYPNTVSLSLLPTDLTGLRVADIASGPGMMMHDGVVERGGEYIAVDFDPNFLAVQKAKGNPKVAMATVLKLPFADKSLDITHTRFLIMNLPEQYREYAIHELARVGKANYILDWDWGAFKPVNPTTEKLISAAREFGNIMGSDLEHGKKLKELASMALGIGEDEIEEQVINEGPIKIYGELAGLAASFAKKCSEIGKKELEAQFTEVIDIIKQGNSPDLQDPFMRPNIVAIKF